MSPVPEPSEAAEPAREDPGRLSIRYELSDRDAVAVCRDAGFRHPKLRRKLVPALAVVAIVGLAFNYWYGGIIPTAGAVIGFSVFYYLILPKLLGRQARSNPAFRGPHTLEITPAAIGGETRGVGQTRVFWSTVVGVGSTAGYLMIFWQSGGTTVIPRRAFPTGEAADEFLSAARRWHAAATASEVSAASSA